jgi:hypothetical protein
MKTSGTAPSPRRAAASCVVGDRWLVIHGGFEGSRCLDDCYVLDTERLVWDVLTQPSTSQTGPSPRALHSMCAIGCGVWLYGGASNNAAQSSAHLLHCPAATAGACMQLELQGSCSKAVEALCKQEAMQAALEVAEKDAINAGKHREVLACLLSPSLCFLCFLLSFSLPACIHLSYWESSSFVSSLVLSCPHAST